MIDTQIPVVTKSMNFGLKTKLRLLNIPTDPRYWLSLTASLNVKKFENPLERSHSL